MNKAIILFAALVLLAAGGAAVGLAVRMQRESADEKNPATAVTTRVKPFTTGENLTSYDLTERSGRKFDSKSLAGKVHVVNFFYATCPARCPLQTQHIAKLQELLQKKGLKEDKVMLLSITVDPEQDTPAALREYAQRNNADTDQWMFLTGDADYLSRVAVEIYEVPYETKTHNEKVILVDKWGRIRGRYRWYDPTDFAILQREMTMLVDEAEPPPLAPPPVVELPGAKEAREEEEEERAYLAKQKAEQQKEEQEKADKEKAEKPTESAAPK